MITEEDRDTMFAMLEDCERESEVSDLRQKLHLLTYYLKGLFSSAYVTESEYGTSDGFNR